MRVKATACLLLPVLLAGCALGSSRYSCKGRPGAPLCRSMTEVYEKTHDREALIKLEREKHEAEVADQNAPPIAPLSPQPTVPVEDPMPIRTPAKVMRIWIAPWEDEEGDLIASGYVYAEIEPRRWQVGQGHQDTTFSRVLEPLNPKAQTAPLLPARASGSRPAGKPAQTSTSSGEKR